MGNLQTKIDASDRLNEREKAKSFRGQFLGVILPPTLRLPLPIPETACTLYSALNQESRKMDPASAERQSVLIHTLTQSVHRKAARSAPTKDYRGSRWLIICRGSVVSPLAAVEIALGIGALLRAEVGNREAAGLAGSTGRAVPLAVGTVLLAFAPVGLRLLLSQM